MPFANAVAVVELGAPAAAFLPIIANEPEPRVVSGASDALHISCRHTALPAERAIVVHVAVQNVTDLEITGITLQMGVLGVLDFAPGQQQATYEIGMQAVTVFDGSFLTR